MLRAESFAVVSPHHPGPYLNRPVRGSGCKPFQDQASALGLLYGRGGFSRTIEIITRNQAPKPPKLEQWEMGMPEKII
jgi:hypothetical protein